MTAREARRLVAVGELMTANAPGWLGEVGKAVESGAVSVDAAEAITTGLGDPTGSVDAGTLAHAAEQLLAEAATSTVEELAKTARFMRDELDAEGVFEDHFVLDAGTTGNVVVFVTVDWEDSDEFEFPNGRADLPENCGQDTTTTSSSIEATTTTSEVQGETSTTAVGLLPFTGSGSGPMLLAGIGLVAGGLLFLWSSGTRNASR